VHFLGALPHKRLLELFRAADLAYQPASAGVFPNAALEALAVGRPVLTTTEPGSPELVRDGESGFVLAQPDALQLAGAIDRYIDDEKLRGRLELNASATALDYTPELTYSKMERVFAAASNEPA
jgi:glycosyltransferase involved in cell wall biosynthesis